MTDQERWAALELAADRLNRAILDVGVALASAITVFERLDEVINRVCHAACRDYRRVFDVPGFVRIEERMPVDGSPGELKIRIGWGFVGIGVVALALLAFP